MKAPETKAAALDITRGIDNPSTPLIYEMYTRDQANNILAIKVFEDGLCYQFRKSRSKKINDPSLKWKKLGQLSDKDISNINDIIKDEAADYIDSPYQKLQDKPLSFTHWYFHGDNSYAYTQKQRFRFQPKFIRKLDRILNF
jgi:hypothetical protein